jgi:hypothetical protein
LTDSGAWSGRYAPATAEIKEKAIVRGLLWCLEPRGLFHCTLALRAESMLGFRISLFRKIPGGRSNWPKKSVFSLKRSESHLVVQDSLTTASVNALLVIQRWHRRFCSLIILAKVVIPKHIPAGQVSIKCRKPELACSRVKIQFHNSAVLESNTAPLAVTTKKLSLVMIVFSRRRPTLALQNCSDPPYA